MKLTHLETVPGFFFLSRLVDDIPSLFEKKATGEGRPAHGFCRGSSGCGARANRFHSRQVFLLLRKSHSITILPSLSLFSYSRNILVQNVPDRSVLVACKHRSSMRMSIGVPHPQE